MKNITKKDFFKIGVCWVIVVSFFVLFMYIYKRYSPIWISKIEFRDPYLHYKKGKEFLKKGKLEKAKEEFYYAIRFDPKNAQFQFAYGDVLEKEGNVDKAIEYYKRSVALSPNTWNYYYRLAYVYLLKKKDLDKAEYYFKKTMELTKNNNVKAKSYYYIGEIKEKKNDYISAFYYYEKYLTLNKSDVKVLLKLADMYYKQGFYKKALEKYQKYLKISPNDKTIIEKIYDCESHISAKTPSLKLFEE